MAEFWADVSSISSSVYFNQIGTECHGAAAMMDNEIREHSLQKNYEKIASSEYQQVNTTNDSSRKNNTDNNFAHPNGSADSNDPNGNGITNASSGTLVQQTAENIEISSSVVDYQHVKQYVDSVLEFNNEMKKKKQHAEHIKYLFTEAVMKTAVEKINLAAKGHHGRMRLVQIASRLSINSIEISEDARKARDEYSKVAKIYNTTANQNFKPKINEYAKGGFQRILANDFQIDIDVGKNIPFPVYETGEDFQSTDEFKCFYNELTK